MSLKLTLFSIPKGFEGHIGVIQRNAVRSWTQLPETEVILMGDDAGVGETARRMNIRYIEHMRRNSLGTPLLDDAFAKAAQSGRAPLLCYVNADIILAPDVVSAAASMDKEKFLMVGQRWDLDLESEIPTLSKDDVKDLQRRASLHPPAGSDYFIFPRDIDWGFPRFAVGRPGWDNWLIYRARSMRIPVVDATAVTTVIHQNHDYSHMRKGTGLDWEGEEAELNRELMGGYERLFTLFDATHVLTSKGLKRALDAQRFKRRFASTPILHPWAKPAFSALSRFLSRVRGAA